MTDAYQEATTKLVDYIGQTVEFAKGQLPDVANQMLEYGATANTFYLIVFGIIFIIALFSLVISVLNDAGGGIVLSVAVIFVSGIIMVGSVTDLMKISNAPKLYVLEQAKSLVGKCEK